MEQLQSTKILDREILEDARKKALRILKAADEEISAKNSEWEKKTTEIIFDLNKKYNEMREAASMKIMARLPVDKHRLKIEKIETLLKAAVESWYGNLSRGEVLEILKHELSRKLKALNEQEIENSKQITVYFSGLAQDEASSLFASHFSVLTYPLPSDGDHFPKVILELEYARITVSVKKIIDSLLDEKREELVEVLVGRNYMEEL